MPLSLRFLLSLAILGALGAAAPAQSARDRAVELTATVQETPPVITLQWPATGLPVLSQAVLRRLKGELTWQVFGAPPVGATSFSDASVLPGVAYEYYVQRRFNGAPTFAAGYLMSGIRVPVVAERGRVLLIVDDTMASPLAVELATWMRDLQGDGWTVVRTDISRANATPPGVRATIQSLRAADPARTSAVILFGRIPVPYSGDFAIDGHPNHFGAWPTDAYYGDMDGVWTDSEVNDAGADDPRNKNIPGDGKFDQTVLPSAIELQVGRIDLSSLPAFNVNETELLRRYLNRDHNYRHRLGAFADVPQRGLVDDNFGYFNGEAFAVTAWRGFTPCVGAGNVTALDWFDTLQTQAYQWALGCGGGSYLEASGVGTAADFANKTSLAVFNVLFGSYFGDWDNSNAFLRAPLAGTAASLGLASVWSGRPHWVFHSMALGETIGYATRATQNNDNSADEGYDSGYGAQFNHLALLGDPTLRLYPVSPPASIGVTAGAQAVSVSWSGSADGGIQGYLVSRAPTASGPFTLLHGGLVSGTSFVDRNVAAGSSYVYLVRAVKLETSPSGSFSNPSQGIYSASIAAPAAPGPELNVSGGGNPIATGATTPIVADGTDFGAVETGASLAHSFTITNAGAAALTFQNAAIGGANPGDFTFTTYPPPSLAAGASAVFVVKFQPRAKGARAATLSLTTNDADESTAAFALSGTGLEPPASLSAFPPAFARSIHPSDTAAESLRISDPAAGTLQYTITSSLTRYSALDSDSFAGPAYAWVDIAPTGTLVSFPTADDSISATLPLGFAFPFYGAPFTTLRVCTNGYVSFTDTDTNATNSTLPNRRAAANLVAPFWSDLNIDATSRVFAQNLGGNFIVQFENVSLFSSSALRITCQAIFKTTGEIVFQYKAVPADADYTIGLQNGTFTDALTISAHTASAHNGLAIRIRPPGAESWLTPPSASGDIAARGILDIAIDLNATGLSAGNYSADLLLTSNAPVNSALTVPVHLTVGNTPAEDWRIANFGNSSTTGNAGDNANPDGDTQVNLLEYAFASPPTISDSTNVPVVSYSSGGYLQIRFSRHTGRTDLRYLVEASTDLTNPWTTIAASVHGAPISASGAHSILESGSAALRSVTVEDSAPASSYSKRYLRLRIVHD